MDAFYRVVDAHIHSFNEKYRAKYVIRKEMYEDIIFVLRDGWGDPKLKFWVQKNFVLVEIGNTNVVYNTGKDSRSVVTYEELYTKLDECHKRVGHHGRDKTWNQVKSQYSWVPYDIVMMFIKMCDACSNRQPFPKFPASRPIVSLGYLTRIQIDLIDTRCRPDGEFKWILHAKDHFSKFSWAYPLKTKEAEPVAERLLQQFYSFGPPRILQSDNDKEFVAKVIKDLKNTWTDLVIINGRARHPQTQGLVERLAPVAYSINTSTACTTRKTLYEVVFGQPPRSDFEMWKKLSDEGVEDEENMPIDIITAFAEVHQSTTDDGLTDLPEDSNRSSDRIETRVLRTESSASHSYSIDPEVVSVVAILVDKASSRATDEFIGLPESEVASENVSSTTENEIGHLSSASLRDGRHKRIRTEAEIDYLKAIAKRQRIYDNAIKNSQYKVGDLVGLKLDRVDRTNTTPKILPCKVVSISPSSNDTVIYRLCTLKGVLSVSYDLQDLLDLTKCDFGDLRAVDSAGLPTLTFIQAYKEYISAGGIQFTETCHCNGKCATKACPCVSKGIKCSTKCHPKKKQSCSNVE